MVRPAHACALALRYRQHVAVSCTVRCPFTLSAVCSAATHTVASFPSLPFPPSPPQVANYPYDGYPDHSHQERKVKAASPDDATFVHLASTYARMHSSMASSKVWCMPIDPTHPPTLCILHPSYRATSYCPRCPLFCCYRRTITCYTDVISSTRLQLSHAPQCPSPSPLPSPALASNAHHTRKPVGVSRRHHKWGGVVSLVRRHAGYGCGCLGRGGG